MNAREILLLVGAAVFGLAFIEMVSPRLLRPPLDEEFIYAIGALLLFYACFILEARDKIDDTEFVPPEPEDPVSPPVPGADFEQVLHTYCDAEKTNSATITTEGLTEAAIEALTRFEKLSENEARSRIASGTWTDDPYAASFLATTDVSLPFHGRVLDFLIPQLAHQRNIRHTVDAIADLADIQVPKRSTRETVTEWKTGFIPPSYEQPRDEHEPDSPLETDPTAITAIENDDSQLDSPRPTYHWFGIGTVALVCLGIGLLVEQPAVFLAGIVGIGYASYARTSPLDDVTLSLDRTTDPSNPRPGEDVEVTVTVTNKGTTAIPDLRVIDGVPDALEVTEGSPRYGTPLQPGASVSFSYTVAATRGRFEFEPLTAIARNLPATTELVDRLTDETTVTCTPALQSLSDTPPLRNQATQRAGTMETSEGGSGLEFYATREYRRGDPLNRIDWNRYARTGDLSTREFREDQAASVVIGIDTLPTAFVSPDGSPEHAVDRSVHAASRVFSTLLNTGHQVGITSIGPVESWLAPSSGQEHRVRGRNLLATNPALASAPRDDHGDPQAWRSRLQQRLPTGAQVIVLSPLCDPLIVETIRHLEAYGHPVSVISPDPTTTETKGTRLIKVRRSVNLTDLRREGIPVIDWAGEPLDRAVAKHGGEP